MANVYKLVKRHKGIKYFLMINNINSVRASVDSILPDGSSEFVAEVSLKTGKVKLLKELPEPVVEAIERSARG